MECDVAVLGGGPGGYTAAIRAAQLGARASASRRRNGSAEPASASGCIPTKAWVQTAFALKEAEETFPKLGVTVGAPQLDFAAANSWKDGGRRQADRGRRQPLQGERRRVGARASAASRTRTRSPSKAGRTSASRARSSPPARTRCGRRSTASTPRAASTRPGLLGQTEVPKRLVILGGGIIGCEFASILQRFGSEVTIVEMLPTLIPQEDEDAAKELLKQFKKRGITVHLESQCDRIEESRRTALPCTSAGRPSTATSCSSPPGAGPVTQDLGLEDDRRRARPARRASRPTSTGGRPSPTSTRSATVPATGSSPTPPSARARWPPRTRWATTRSSTTAACRARSTPTRRSPASGSPSARRASSTATTSWSARSRSRSTGAR